MAAGRLGGSICPVDRRASINHSNSSFVIRVAQAARSVFSFWAALQMPCIVSTVFLAGTDSPLSVAVGLEVGRRTSLCALLAVVALDGFCEEEEVVCATAVAATRSSRLMRNIKHLSTME